MAILFMILAFLLMAVVNAAIFCILVAGEVNLRDSFRLSSAATAINKFLFTGSGYIASSYFSRYKKLSFHKAISAFFLLEFLAVFLWLVMGIAFGARLAVKIPALIVAGLIVFAITAWVKKDKFVPLIRNVAGALKEMGTRVFFVTPFVGCHMALFTMYYFFLFRNFGFEPGFFAIIKIISVSYTIGYLSPAPAGLGFKETGIVVLLMQSGLSLNHALAIAVFDRIFSTVFWSALGLILGFDMIKQAMANKFRRKS